MPARTIVFVVDDDLSMLKGVERLLNVRGFEARLFSSFDEFLTFADLRIATCVVLDIQLNGRSGIELRRLIAERNSSIPVIFITGNDTETVRKAATDAGCFAYLVKPFTAASLAEAVMKASRFPDGSPRPN